MKELAQSNLHSTDGIDLQTKKLQTLVKELNISTGEKHTNYKLGNSITTFAPKGNEMTKTQIIRLLIDRNQTMASQATRGSQYKL